MNLFNLTGSMLSAILLLSGCGDKTDQTLSPPDNARRVTVTFKVPEGTQLLPMQLLFRSDKCMSESHDSSMKSYPVRGYNGFKQNFIRQENSNIWQTRIVIDGGGPCQWQLNSLKVSFKIADNVKLTQGKDLITTNYIFDFDKYGFSDGYGTGEAKEVSGDMAIHTDFFPLVIINHISEKTRLRLFAGNTRSYKWVRRYMLRDTKNIHIEPNVHLDKPVIVEGQNPPPGHIMATYPDGHTEALSDPYPDYEKLLSMK